MSDKVNHPTHYNNHPSGVECIEIVRHMNYNRGTAMAYIWRAGNKDDEIEDLQKAVWHINDEIKQLKRDKANKEIAELNEKLSRGLSDGVSKI